MNQLERLLSTSLPVIKDDDFSLKVIEKIRRVERRANIFMSCMVIAILTCFAVFVPKLMTTSVSFFSEQTSKIKLFDNVTTNLSPIAYDLFSSMQTPAGLIALSCILVVSCLMKFDI